MNEALLRSVFRAVVPMMPGLFKKITAKIIEIKNNTPLLEGETHVAGLIHEEYGKVFIIICAFKDETITRKIMIINTAETQKLLTDGIPNS